ncbi:hypothetical protein [Aliiroseovarius sediminilitoris]|uniref:hypothetical protein n=1 Tax=Aliiroseovarius sediminilitoris TaxID=1173584 RepID=UPI0015A70E9E|nr:hypothetical protein [Aliiroseovarius sediminilitoris]
MPRDAALVSVTNAHADIVAQRTRARADDRACKKVAAGRFRNHRTCGRADTGALKIVPLASCQHDKGCGPHE